MQEMVDGLPGLIDEFTRKEALLSSDEVKKSAKAALGILMTAGLTYLGVSLSDKGAKK